MSWLLADSVHQNICFSKSGCMFPLSISWRLSVRWIRLQPLSRVPSPLVSPSGWSHHALLVDIISWLHYNHSRKVTILNNTECLVSMARIVANTRDRYLYKKENVYGLASQSKLASSVRLRLVPPLCTKMSYMHATRMFVQSTPKIRVSCVTCYRLHSS